MKDCGGRRRSSLRARLGHASRRRLFAAFEILRRRALASELPLSHHPSSTTTTPTPRPAPPAIAISIARLHHYAAVISDPNNSEGNAAMGLPWLALVEVSSTAKPSTAKIKLTAFNAGVGCCTSTSVFTIASHSISSLPSKLTPKTA